MSLSTEIERGNPSSSFHIIIDDAFVTTTTNTGVSALFDQNADDVKAQGNDEVRSAPDEPILEEVIAPKVVSTNSGEGQTLLPVSLIDQPIHRMTEGILLVEEARVMLRLMRIFNYPMEQLALKTS
ncbi:hypothetical protein ACLOJK_007267 [Asimina triloba]